MKKFEIVYQDLKTQIINDEITSILPSETTIMKKYNVGRGSARMAIAKLIEDGYCISKHGIGSFVLPALRTKEEKINYVISDYEVVKIDEHLNKLTTMTIDGMVLKLIVHGYVNGFLMKTSTTYLTIDDFKSIEEQTEYYLQLLNNDYSNYVKTDQYSCLSDLKTTDEFKIKDVRYTYNLDGSIYEYSEFLIHSKHFNLSLVNNK